MSFADDLKRITDSAKRNADAVVRKIVIDVGTSLVMKSPVGDASYWKMPAPAGYVGGRYRGNWQFGIGRYDTKTSEAVDASGSVSINRVVAGVPQDAGGNVYYITNSLPYGPRLEEGWSRQAPNGMVRLTISEFEPIVAAAARAIR